jgi:hypothetical protein
LIRRRRHALDEALDALHRQQAKSALRPSNDVVAAAEASLTERYLLPEKTVCVAQL